VNVLDENILESQRQLLRSWKISVRQIGVELGRKGMADEEILPFLLTLSKPTFFTRDLGFANAESCHARRCLVVLAIGQYEAAHPPDAPAPCFQFASQTNGRGDSRFGDGTCRVESAQQAAIPIRVAE
jgi:hypothetical protein